MLKSVAIASCSARLRLPSCRPRRQRAICYNCPPQWADWGSQLKAIRQAKLGIEVPPDNKNSGQATAADRRESQPRSPMSPISAASRPTRPRTLVCSPLQASGLGQDSASLKDPEGLLVHDSLGHAGPLCNKAALGGKPVPQSWSDLLKPEYKGLVGYLDPTSASVRQLGVMAVNLALGGTYENLDPGIKYFKALQKNQPIVPKQTSYARVISGEIPILLDYDFNAYRGQYTDKAPVQFVIPKEGTVVFPYVMGLVNKGPNPANGKKVLDFVLSDESQAMWGNAFLRPVFADKLSAEAKSKFLPDAEYARAKPIDLKKLAAAQKTIVDRYRDEVQ
jgi:putative spermidine/putrescine transport system substrate-binding protein